MSDPARVLWPPLVLARRLARVAVGDGTFTQIDEAPLSISTAPEGIYAPSLVSVYMAASPLSRSIARGDKREHHVPFSPDGTTPGEPGVG